MMEMYGDKIVLPEDIIVASSLSEGATTRLVIKENISDNVSIVSIIKNICDKL